MLCIEGDCHLRGIVHGHPNHKDDTMIITSKIVNFSNDSHDEQTVKTVSGRTYHLLTHRDLNLLFNKFAGKDWP